MVAVQIRDVPEPVREVLAEEAERRGESLQSYLLAVLTREAETDVNRRLVVDWAKSPLVEVQLSTPEVLEEERANRDRRIDAALRD